MSGQSEVLNYQSTTNTHALEGHFPVHFFIFMMTTKHQFVDPLATLASMLKIVDYVSLKTVDETRDDPSYRLNVEVKPDGNPWYHDVKCFCCDSKM